MTIPRRRKVLLTVFVLVGAVTCAVAVIFYVELLKEFKEDYPLGPQDKKEDEREENDYTETTTRPIPTTMQTTIVTDPPDDDEAEPPDDEETEPPDDDETEPPDDDETEPPEDDETDPPEDPTTEMQTDPPTSPPTSLPTTRPPYTPFPDPKDPVPLTPQLKQQYPFLHEECGRFNRKRRPPDVYKTQFSFEASYGEFPWHVLLGRTEPSTVGNSKKIDPTFYGSGSIVGLRYVLTTADICRSILMDRSRQDYEVFCVANARTKRDAKLIVKMTSAVYYQRVERCVYHLFYDPTSPTHENNIGLVRLREPYPGLPQYSGDAKHQNLIIINSVCLAIKGMDNWLSTSYYSSYNGSLEETRRYVLLSGKYYLHSIQNEAEKLCRGFLEKSESHGVMEVCRNPRKGPRQPPPVCQLGFGGALATTNIADNVGTHRAFQTAIGIAAEPNQGRDCDQTEKSFFTIVHFQQDFIKEAYLELEKT